MSEPRQRKLTTMGIACLVASGRPEVLDRLKGEVFNMWLDVFGEMKEAIAEFNGVQSRFVIITGILTTASFINLCHFRTDPSPLSSLVTFWRDTGDVLPDNILELEGTAEFERWKVVGTLFLLIFRPFNTTGYN